MSPNPKGTKPKRGIASKLKNSSKDAKDPVEDVEEKEGKVMEALSYLFFWSERYNSQLERVWNKLPTVVGSFLASLAVFTFGLFARGEWMIFFVYFVKYVQTFGSPTYKEESEVLINSFSDWLNVRFNGYWNTWIYSTLVSYLAYFGIGGFLHWYYYVRQRDRPEEWKCQPKKWLSPALERHEIFVGSLSLAFGSAISAGISTYVINGGKAIWLYIHPGEYGYIWLILQIPIVFMYQDYLTYWHHRMYHTPWLYKNFHKLHHTYKQPTAFSVTAIHPIEFMHMQCVLLSAVFIVPVYWLNYSVMMAYVYYHGIIDHSGINFKRKWWQPWQPDCIFHDNHHQYFHVNFGFNIEYWDHLHGTYRRKDRIYREDIYYGYGKSVDDASVDELKKDLAERKSENPKAYPKDQYGFEMDVDLNKGHKNK